LSRWNNWIAFVFTGLVKPKMPLASNGFVAMGIHWFKDRARFEEVNTQ